MSHFIPDGEGEVELRLFYAKNKTLAEKLSKLTKAEFRKIFGL